MRPRRPSILPIVAILNFIGAGLSIAILTYLLLAMRTRDTEELPEALKDSDDLVESIELELHKVSGQLFQTKVPSHSGTRRAEIAVGFVLAVLMIAAGIGLYLTKPWGRILAIAYAMASLSNHFFCMG